MLSSRTATRCIAALAVLALSTATLTACGTKSASKPTDAVSASANPYPSPSPSPSPGATPTKPATKTATPAGIPSLPQIAPSTTLEPVNYAGFEPLPSFTYHHVDPKLKNNIAITPATFEAQLKTLKSMGYHTVTARDVADHQANGTALPDKPVMITFDDGWRNQFTFAWPLLKKYGFKATFFINPQPINGHYGAYMTRDMVVTLAKAGMDIENHTWRHLPLTRNRKYTAQQFQTRYISETTRATKWIATVTGKSPIAICYPYGYYDLEAIGLAKSLGYTMGFTVDEGVADARAWDAFGMKRFTIQNTETAASFLRRLTSGPLPVLDIQPPPGTRVVGTSVLVKVDISAVTPDYTGLQMTGGPSMRPMQIVETGGKRYIQAQIQGGKTGFRALSIKAIGPGGRMYYASWGIETGDKP